MLPAKGRFRKVADDAALAVTVGGHLPARLVSPDEIALPVFIQPVPVIIAEQQAGPEHQRNEIISRWHGLRIIVRDKTIRYGGAAQ